MLGTGLMRIATAWLASEETQSTIARRFKDATGGQLSFDRVGIKWRLRPSIWFEGVEAGVAGIINGNCRSVAIFPSMRSLLKGDLRISKVIVSRPDIDVSPWLLSLPAPALSEDDRSAPSAKEDLWRRLANLSFPYADSIPHVDIRIQDGFVGFPDTALHLLRISGLNLRLRHNEKGLAIRLQSHSTHWDHQEITLALDSSTRRLFGSIRLTHLKPLPPIEQWARDSGFSLRHVGNNLLAATFQGVAGKEIRAEIECTIDDIRVDRPPKTQSIKSGRLSAELHLSPGPQPFEFETFGSNPRHSHERLL